jgi:hypothetical protein
MYIGLRVKYPLFFSDFNEISNFLNRFSQNTQIPTFMKTRTVEAEFFHADRQTDMTKLIVALRNFSNAPKKTVSVRGSHV